VPSDKLGYYFFPFAIGNLLGPLTIGHLFDTVGRRKMIMLTYCVSGVLLAVSALFFQAGALNAVTQTIFWCVIFFLASAGASSAYLTVSEIFPLELRAQAMRRRPGAVGRTTTSRESASFIVPRIGSGGTRSGARRHRRTSRSRISSRVPACRAAPRW